MQISAFSTTKKSPSLAMESRDDLKRFVKQELTKPEPASSGAGIPQMPAVDFSKFGPVETTPLSRIRKLSAQNLHRSWLHVPHVT